MAGIERHVGELFPRIGFIVTDSGLPAEKMVTAYNGRGHFENRIEEGKNTLRRDKTNCCKLAANQTRLLIGIPGYNLLHMLRESYLRGEEVKRSTEWLVKRPVKVGTKVAYHARRRQVRAALAFPSARHYRAVFG